MPRLRALAAAAATATFAGLNLATPAAAYPVDCAILLCLAGGWPASVECARARAVFIARITPWPVEPPLQIWNCPMRASFRHLAQPMDRLLEIAFTQQAALPLISVPDAPTGLLRVENQADVDISDPAYDFVRSIHVFQIQYSRRRNRDGDCTTSHSILEGTYGTQGDFAWARSVPDRIPVASEFDPGTSCSNYGFRSVFVDWQDFEGTYGFEEVRY